MKIFLIQTTFGAVASVQQEKTNLYFQVQNQATKEQKDLKAVDFGSFIQCPTPLLAQGRLALS